MQVCGEGKEKEHRRKGEGTEEEWLKKAEAREEGERGVVHR